MWVSATDAARIHEVSERHLRTLAAALGWRKLRYRRKVHYLHTDLEAWQDARQQT